MIDDYPVAEAIEGLVAATVALGLAQTQPESIRRPLVAAVALSLVVAWAFDLAPGRLALAGTTVLVLSLSPDRPVRFLGGFVAIGALATSLPAALGGTERLVTLGAVAVVVALSAPSRPAFLDAWVVVFAAAAVGGFLALPDTERIAFVGGVMAAVVVAVVVLRRRSVSSLGLALAGALVVWAGAVDARGRPAAFVSVLAPLTLLVALALVARWSRRPPLLIVVVTAAALAVFAGRVAGLRTRRERGSGSRGRRCAGWCARARRCRVPVATDQRSSRRR